MSHQGQLVEAVSHVIDLIELGVPSGSGLSAPAGFAAKVEKVLGFVKYLSLAGCMAMLLGIGIVLVAANGGHGGGPSQKMKESVGWSCAGLLVIGSASQIAAWML